MADKDLWCAVLHQAIDDALKGVPSIVAKNYDDRVLMTTQAREYLTKPSKDLATVCAFAGVNMDAVIDRMRKQIANSSSVDELVKDRKPCKATYHTHNGETLTIKEWSDRTGISKPAITKHLGKGRSISYIIANVKAMKKKDAA